MYTSVEVVGSVRWRLARLIDRHFKLGNSTCGASVHCGHLLYALEGVDCSGIDASQFGGGKG